MKVANRLFSLRTSSLLSTGIVLSGLIGIGWGGHALHWTLPDVWHAGVAPQANLGRAADDSQVNRSPEDDAPSSGATVTLPNVEFRSASAAHNCGIECDTAQPREIKHFVTANGVVDYDQTRIAQLSVRVPGIVWRVEKRLGSAVQAGDVLAIIDAAEIGQAKAALLEATARHKFDVRIAERLEQAQNAVTYKEILAARYAEEASRTQFFNAAQRLMALGLPLRADEIESLSTDELADRLQGLGLPPPYDSHIPSANLTSLVAPFSGVVTNCEIVRGELVDTTKPQYVIADIDRLWINLAVREEDVSKLHVGAPVEFSSDIGTSRITCTLTWIGTEIDPRTRTVKARAEGENPRLDDHEPDVDSRRRFQAGTFGIARIVTGNSQAAVVLPNNALHWQWEIGREIIFVPSTDGCAFIPRIVTKGVVRDGYTQIVTGLSPGEPVVTAGARVLSSELSEQLRRQLAYAARARDFGPAGPALPDTERGE